MRLIRGDGVDVLEHLLGSGSLTGVRVFFPDPWPKARHHKRRLLQPETVALIADRLKPGGILHAATDHAGYAEQIAEVGDAEPLLRRLAPDPTRLPISASRPVTKYEAKARHAGSAVTEFLWERCSMSVTEDIEQLEPHSRDACAADTRAAARAPGVGRPESRHGPRLDPRWQADRCAPAPLRRARPLAAGPHRRTVRRPRRRESAGHARAGGHGLHQHRAGSADVVRPWVEALRNVGFAVFAKPKIDDDSDVDSDMLDHIALRRREGLASVYVASADGQAFRLPLEEHRPRRHRRAAFSDFVNMRVGR